VPWFEPKNRKSYSAIGCYINYLEIGNLILIPQFCIDGNRDVEALTLFKRVYGQKKVEFVEINRIAKQGGVLNCISWGIYKA